MNTILTVIVAAGRGRRMGSEVPKQFLLLDKEPIVMRTIRRMAEAVEDYLMACSQNVNEIVDEAISVNNYVHKIILLLPDDSIPLWDDLCREHDFRIPHRVVTGGDTRFQSVKNGLAAEPEADIILVHDGVRPFANNTVVAGVIRAVAASGAAIPVVPMTDSLRQITSIIGDESTAVDRAAFRAVQTPQGFRGELLRRAYDTDYSERFTDDASVVESTTSISVILTKGDLSNIKITTPFDLKVAEVLLKG